MISIITVTFNSAVFLSHTIDSIRYQNYSNYEYIIIDGGSTDGTLDIIKNNLDIIKYWVSEPDEGIYDAMNKGISVASGRIIGILNSDDWLEPNALNEVHNCAVNIEEDIFIIHGKIATFNANDIFIREHGPKNYIGYQLFSTPFKHPAMFVTKATYDNFGLFNINCGLASDYDLMLRFFYGGVKDYYINKVLTNVRLVGVSTGGNSNATYRELYNIIYKNTGNFIKAGIAIFVRMMNSITKKFT
jgi:glycosyltransferase involved in cell wall biosynthesis